MGQVDDPSQQLVFRLPGERASGGIVVGDVFGESRAFFTTKRQCAEDPGLHASQRDLVGDPLGEAFGPELATNRVPGCREPCFVRGGVVGKPLRARNTQKNQSRVLAVRDWPSHKEHAARQAARALLVVVVDSQRGRVVVEK